jgi:hypothetical protein
MQLAQLPCRAHCMKFLVYRDALQGRETILVCVLIGFEFLIFEGRLGRLPFLIMGNLFHDSKIMRTT